MAVGVGQWTGDAGAAAPTGLASLPPGSKIIRTSDTIDVYQDPAGNIYEITRATGEVDRGNVGGGPQPTLERKTIGDLRDAIHDEVGVGGDDLSSTAEFKMLKDAADQFGANYAQDRATAADSRGMDLDTIARLRAAEEGKTPSAAEALMRKAIDQNASQALGLAATVGGSNPGMALRAGLEAQQTAGSRSAADIAALRAKEIDAARELLAGQTAKGRAVDTSAAASAGNTFAGSVAAPYQAIATDKAAQAAREAAIIQAGGQVVAASDIRGKTDVQPAPAMADDFLRNVASAPVTARGLTGDPRAADDFLSTLRPQSFQYKNPDGVNKQPGTRLGVMAQDLPAHDVVTDPSGKKWISADVMNDVLAGLGRVNQKVDSVTGGSGRGGRARQPQRRQPVEPQQQQEVMIPQSAVHDYLAGLGITAP